MGCNNSHLRPFFRRCRRRSKKDETNCTPKRQLNDLTMNDSNHMDANSTSTTSTDLIHGFQFIGSSVRNSPILKQSSSDTSNPSDAPICVPLLAQSEISHSQLDFFKMLDEKIQEGPDYDSDEEQKETERLIQKNIDTWNRSVKSHTWKIGGNRLGNNSNTTTTSSRCQWDDEGDGG